MGRTRDREFKQAIIQEHYTTKCTNLLYQCPLYKYVDDGTLFEICSTTLVSLLQDIASKCTKENNMINNASKTKEVVICFCKDEHHIGNIPRIRIEEIPIERVSHTKVLGITLSNNLSWNAHVDSIANKAGKRLYMLFQLKRAGVCQSDLVHPVVEYACPVWHSGLPRYLSDSIEMVQKRAVSCIYPGEPYNEILERTNLPTLAERRSKIRKEYFSKIKKDNHKLNHLLPDLRTVPYKMRTLHQYCVPKARTERFKNFLSNGD